MVNISAGLITVKRCDGSTVRAQFWSVAGPKRRWVLTTERTLLEVRLRQGESLADEIREWLTPEAYAAKKLADEAKTRRERYLARCESDRRAAWSGRHSQEWQESCESCGAPLWSCVVYRNHDPEAGRCEFGGCRMRGTVVYWDGRLMCDRDAKFLGGLGRP